MWMHAKSVLAVRWRPGHDTIVAAFSAAAMWPIYYLGMHTQGNLVGSAGFLILGAGVLGVLFPAAYLLLHHKAPLADLGLTTRRLGPALALSAVFATAFWPALAMQMAAHPTANVWPHLVFSGLTLWKPFFVFGWLQLRFERAFGIVPGIVLAAVCLGLIHVGAVPLAGVGTLVGLGLVCAVVFRIPKSLFAVWPLAWALSGSVGTLQGGRLFGWGHVAAFALLLVGQIAGLVWIVRKMPRPTEEQTPAAPTAPRRSLFWKVATLFGSLVLVWGVAAYAVLPAAWRSLTKRHPALDEMPLVTRTGNGIPGDPINIALVGTEEEVQQIMLTAGWSPADPITLKSSLRIAAGTVFRRPYETAPVSNLFLWGRKQDLAFQQPVGDDPRKRHHVRFWRSEKLDEDGRPLWVGSDTFDKAVGLSYTTAQITHHIDADLDAERNKLLDDLQQTPFLSGVYWRDDVVPREGRNGGGDPYFTDGRLPIAVVSLGHVPRLSAADEDADLKNLVESP